MTTRVTPSSASQSPRSSSAAVIVVTVRTSCNRCRPGPRTRAQHTTSALLTSRAATRSMISGSSVSTRIALASRSVGGGHPQELQGRANLILVLQAHATAHSAAPGARLQTGLARPSHHDVDGRPRPIFGPERHSPTGDIQDFMHGSLLLLGAYPVVRLHEPLGFWLAALLGIALTGLAGLLLDRLLFSRMRGAPVISLAILTIGVDILLATEITREIGSDILNIGHPWGGGVINLGPVGITTNRA